ncbi:YbcC family protein [Vitiosangium sp. GDMCC 1.1324]|uniref:YbcC family protein n=1 Tax=Vitiosangium sp. (strain GDMCC 1.1324) TaxID=2138576 RepID=UPI000D3BF33E|nr:DUF2309 domain-containing protein [Vitiosangium sp. GDMCC 1.1324]PTL76030.1 DUF2309 domain-containing protein [Vitiosangium sp. GDMCC 1.1324]
MSHSPSPTPPAADRGQRLSDVLAHAGHLLPAQGPIGVFVHHNTLHAFQHLPFHEALATASATFETEAYLPESRYRELYRRGRITDEDLKAALAEREAGETQVDMAPVSLSRMELELLALLHPLPEETAASLRWRLAELSASYRLRPDVPEAARQRLLKRSTEGLRAWMERVGRDWTMTDLAVALLEPSMEASVRAAAAEPHRAMASEAALRRLGIPDARAAAYLERVKARLGGTTVLTVEGWLGAEATLVMDALAAAFGGDGSLRSLREHLERQPEPFAVSALWAACRAPLLPAKTGAGETVEPGAVRSHREVLRTATGEDVNDLVHPHLIRACSAFLDEGVSHWNMPGREHGLYAAWSALKRTGLGVLPDWLEGLEKELEQAEHAQRSARDVVLAALDELGVPEAQWEPYLTRVLLALPGWAGMFHRLEHTPADRPAGAPPARLMDFLAVRLTLERHALRAVARRRLDYRGPLSGLMEHARRATAHQPPALERAAEEGSWRLFQLLQLAGLSAMEVADFPLARRQALLAWLEAFDEHARRRVWQEAYEHHYRMDVLQGLAQNRLRPESARTVKDARFQAIFCIDDREEAIRRHFEELDPRHETFGVAGFFGVAIDYQGLDDAKLVSLCPVVVTPAHVVEEHPHPEHGHLAQARARLRALWARFDHGLHNGTHALELGWLLTPLLGLLSALLLPLHIFFPLTVSRMRRALAAKMLPAPRTRLASLREQEQAATAAVSEKARGFTIAEKTARVAATLENMGLVDGFAPLVVFLGHGAVSVNNPHQSAYDCGACGGRHGGPNARLFAEMANRPEVRAKLRERGIHIPDTTWFIGGLHNTTTDEVVLYDTETLPAALHGELAALRGVMDTARTLSAHERCRRFESAPLSISPTAALRHVEERAADLSQARPELGHVTNAACIVGRRSLTHGLFLDRRAFLVSYDPSRDDANGTILERILLAAGPVGAGINLEYYFSCVDNDRYGSGTKLPHNLTGMLGVMDGVESDLRTGLPRQMIEIHEPVRLLIVVDASVAMLSAIYARQPMLRELIGNEWVQLVSVDPVTGEQQRFTPRGFQPVTPSQKPLPVVGTSPEWYRGHRDFLPPALIDKSQGRPAASRRVPSHSGEPVHAVH